jgi:hypothetical protein
MIDLGDITNSRGTEMFLALWVRLWGRDWNVAFQHPRCAWKDPSPPTSLAQYRELHTIYCQSAQDAIRKATPSLAH